MIGHVIESRQINVNKWIRTDQKLPSSSCPLFGPDPPSRYLQSGTLRSQLIYPSAHSSLSDAQLLAILEQVHLPRLAERVGGLAAVRDWEKQLSVGEQQRLAFGRVLVHAPDIVILDEATSALDSANEAALYICLRESGTTLMSIAHRPAVLRHHTHVLHLEGEGKWELLDAENYRFDGGLGDRGNGQAPVQSEHQASGTAVAELLAASSRQALAEH